MQPDNNWRNDTLENLDKEYWENVEGWRLVTQCYELRKVALSKFSIEDLRMMIIEGIGLKYVVPLAVEELEYDLFAEGDRFAGDLLLSVLDIEPGFWKEHQDLWLKVDHLIHNKKSKFKEVKFSTIRFLAGKTA